MSTRRQLDPATEPATLACLRRELHRIPEIGLQLPKTQARLVRELEQLGLEFTTGSAISSIVAIVRGAGRGPAVLLRADMDALPLLEPEGVDYRSEHEGAMHACGHDIHMAGLIGAARILTAQRHTFNGDVVLMFQPGEERRGGARIMIEDGVLDAAHQRVGAAFAVHVGPGRLGQFMTRPGTLLAGSNELRVTIHGKGGHGSTPHTARNPVPVLIAVATAIERFTSERVNPFDPVIATTTLLRAGELVNVIPEEAQLAATVRTLSEENVGLIRDELVPLISNIAEAHGTRASVDFIVDYPVMVNDPSLTSRAGEIIRTHYGADRFELLAEPRMGSEDFAYVAQSVPSSMIFIGCSPEDIDLHSAASLHSPQVLLDDSVLDDHATLLANLAMDWLTTGAHPSSSQPDDIAAPKVR
ncbi:M20 metallopeptidase family protein [Rhodococcus qingshengii]|uniref:M20 metallopeptidase family protein n=1 Tax=Rhodococcus qingshengii TaxID=334542 RepID=UPI0035FB6CEE